MKRLQYLFTLIVSSVILLFTGCGKEKAGTSDKETESGVTYEQVTDCQTEYLHLYSKFASLNGIIYFENTNIIHSDFNDLLMIYDVENDMVFPLCNKAECMHSDDTCSAYIGGDHEEDVVEHLGLFAYDDKIYYLDSISCTVPENCGIFLFQMKPDGSEKVRLMKVAELGGDEFPNGTPFYLIHRGYLYVSGTSTVVEDGEVRNRQIISRYDLKTGTRTAIFEQESTQELAVDTRITAEENRIIFSVQYMPGSDSEEKKLELYSYDISSNTQEKLYEGQVGYSISELRKEGDSIYIGDYFGNVYIYSMSEKVITENCALSNNRDAAVVFGESLAYTYAQNEETGQIELIVRNFQDESQVILQIEDQEAAGSYIRVNLGSDGNMIYEMQSGIGGEASFAHRLVRYDVENRRQEILWSR